MVGFVLACVAVGLLRSYAFHGTNPLEFLVDLVIFFGVMFTVNGMF